MKTNSVCQVLSAAALVLAFASDVLAQCRPGCGCGSCGCGSCSSGGVSTGLLYRPPVFHQQPVYQTGYTHWTPYRGTHSHITTSPQHAPRQFDGRYSNNFYPTQFPQR